MHSRRGEDHPCGCHPPPPLFFFAPRAAWLLLPLLVKLLPFNLAPSSFSTRPRRAGELPAPFGTPPESGS